MGERGVFADGGALFFALCLCFLPPLSKKRRTKAPLSEDAERLRQCQEKYRFPNSGFALNFWVFGSCFFRKKGLQADLRALFFMVFLVRKFIPFLTVAPCYILFYHKERKNSTHGLYENFTLFLLKAHKIYVLFCEKRRSSLLGVYGGGRFSRAAMPFGGREYVPFVNFLVFPAFY